MANQETQFGKALSAGDVGVQTRERNDNLSHVIWIALSSIYIGHRNQGAAFIGEFPNEVLPGKTPIVINPTKAYAPFELQAIAIEGDVNPLDKTLPEVENHPNSRLERNSAYRLARFYEKEFNDFGVAIPKVLIGEDAELVNTVFQTIFPSGAMKELAKTRIIENISFTGVFLDQMRTYMRHEAPGSIRNAKFVDREMKAFADSVLAELMIASERGWAFANEKLNNTEKLIRQRQNGKPGKDWYETPDSRFPNALPPLDLVCLAETGRVPMNLQELETSKTMSDALGKSVVDGLKAALAPSPEDAEALEAGKVDMSEVLRLMKEQEERHKQQIEDILSRINPAAATTETGK